MRTKVLTIGQLGVSFHQHSPYSRSFRSEDIVVGRSKNHKRAFHNIALFPDNGYAPRRRSVGCQCPLWVKSGHWPLTRSRRRRGRARIEAPISLVPLLSSG